MSKRKSQVVVSAVRAATLSVGFCALALTLATPAEAEIHPYNLAGGGPVAPAATGRAIDPTAVISNGTVSLGVNPEGNLIDDAAQIGLTYVPTGGESLYPGCNCEGWGAGEAVSGRFGKAGEDFGDQNIIVESFETTATTATSIVRINDGTDLFRVTHDYFPSASPNLFQVDIMVENLSGAAASVRYRRAMDWDVPPTEFEELVTLITGGATNVIFSSDDGFADGNPFAGPSSILFSGEAVDSGPDDHGALFDFDFGVIAVGSTVSFTAYYGAAATEAEAIAALAVVGAEIFSFGKADPTSPLVGVDGSPNTFIFAFAGVGGSPVGPPREAVPIPFLTPIGLGFIVGLLGLFGIRRLRRV